MSPARQILGRKTQQYLLEMINTTVCETSDADKIQLAGVRYNLAKKKAANHDHIHMYMLCAHIWPPVGVTILLFVRVHQLY